MKFSFKKIVGWIKGSSGEPIQIRPVSRDQLKKEADRFVVKYGDVIKQLSRE
jgi:hypothetical protein